MSDERGVVIVRELNWCFKLSITLLDKVIFGIVVVNVFGKNKQQDLSVSWYIYLVLLFCLHSVLRIR